MSLYYVYVDWTTEESPRPYYVGMGNADRVANPYRSEKHLAVRQLHGWERRVVMSTDSERVACDKETELISTLRTTEGAIGCNVAETSSPHGVGSFGRKGIHLKLDPDVHARFKQYAAKKGKSMQSILEEHACKLASTVKKR